MRSLLVLFALAWSSIAASAQGQAIDLSLPHGDKYGCINRNGQEVAAEFMLLLTDKALTTAASACEISATEANSDGSLILTTQCEMEGETESVQFKITRDDKDKDALVVAAEDGYVMGAVKPCE